MLCPASRAGSNGRFWLCSGPLERIAHETPTNQNVLGFIARSFIGTARCDGSADALPSLASEGLLSQAGGLTGLLVLRGPLLVVFVAHVGYVHPGMRHFIDGAVAVSDPLIRIWIVLIRGGVIVPGYDVDHGAFGEHRRGIIIVDVVGHPVEVEAA